MTKEPSNQQEYTKVPLEAIILAGGLGTRLRDAVPDLPKCMAPVAGRPFLFYVINYLRLHSVERFIFSLGYKHQVIEAYLADQFSRLQYQCVIEEEPLGTGGAIRLAIEKANGEDIIITNGDTLFKADLSQLFSLHNKNKADCTLALKPMTEFDRYGAVAINEKNIITSFQEKKFYKTGLINGGLYILNKQRFLAKEFPLIFSFEKDFLETSISTGKLSGLSQDTYFIDIGIPGDFEKAQKELQRPPLDLASIDKSWTLFLDRDGVINEDKVGSYIFNESEFKFMEGLPGAFKKLSEKFKYIIIATNQRGVGRGLMSDEDLSGIHKKLKAEIKNAGGNIDGIYYCASVHNDDPERKPNPGMATRAIHDFPGIDLSRSIMIGNNFSDMQFGRNAGMFTIFVKTTIPQVDLPHPDIDLLFDGLSDFAKAL